MDNKKLVIWMFIFFLVLTAIPFILEFYYPDAGFIPKGDALRQNGPLLWAHIATDFLIGIAYVSITLTLLNIFKKAGKQIPFSWVFVMFGLFIIACGFTHFMGVFVIWKPWYWIEAGIQYFTVVVSLGTAIAIIPLTPKIFKVIEAVNKSEDRKNLIIKQNAKLVKSQAKLEKQLEKTKRVDELKRWEKLTIDRELRIKELKKKIKKLENERNKKREVNNKK